MTEFKKLKDILSTQLLPNYEKLLAAAENDPLLMSGANSDDESTKDIGSETNYARLKDLHSLLKTTQTSVADASARFLKLALKAKETNPDKQIFNEKTSKAIVDEYDGFVAFVAKFYEVEVPVADTTREDEDDDTPKKATAEANPPPPAEPVPTTPEAVVAQRFDAVDIATADAFVWDFGPKFGLLEMRFAEAVVARAQRETAQQNLMDSLQSVEAAEVEGRQLVTMLEKTSFPEYVAMAAASKKEARARIAAREEQAWQTEVQRRKDEAQSLKARVSTPSALTESLKAIKALLSPPPSAEDDAAPPRDASLPTPSATAFKVFKKAFRELVDEVINRPENENIRMMRSDHYRVVATFGHPGITETAALYQHTEALFGCVGYTIAYTKQPAHSAKTPQHVAELGGSLELPYGGGAVRIHYTTVGYEPYGERLLVFQEPDPAEDAELWFEWHGRATAMVEELDAALASL